MSTCGVCRAPTPSGALNGHAECPSCAAARRTRQEAIVRAQPPLPEGVHLGDVVRISGCAGGATGVVLSAVDWGGAEGWHVAYDRVGTGQYGSWKQGQDGGVLEVVRRTGEAEAPTTGGLVHQVQIRLADRHVAALDARLVALQGARSAPGPKATRSDVIRDLIEHMEEAK